MSQTFGYCNNTVKNKTYFLHKDCVVITLMFLSQTIYTNEKNNKTITINKTAVYYQIC